MDSTSYNFPPSWLSQMMSMNMITSYFQVPGGGSSGIWVTLMMFMTGWLVEMGKVAYGWVSERWQFQYSVTAEFHAGDPAHDWMTTFLVKQQVWKKAWNFKVNAKTLQNRGGVDDAEIRESQKIGNAEYIPTYQAPQLFKWRKYWIELRRSQMYDSATIPSITLRVFTRDVKVVSTLVEEAREIYLESNKPHVIIHTASSNSYLYPPTMSWDDIKRKPRRSLDSVVLEPGVMDTLLEDAREFLSMDEWYQAAGIPYRRGYLLYGPPGTGKSSTIYALAGELELEIYSISLASNSVDDAALAQAVAVIPRRSIFLLEDIDCAFSRGGSDFDDRNPNVPEPPKTNVTLSGLLNIIDGVASQEGILLFATTNHIEDLDSALIRPGRIDLRIQYFHTAREQVLTLFKCFFPSSHCIPESLKEKEKVVDGDDRLAMIERLAKEFAGIIPEKTFTPAEIQGYLLSCKFKPERAVKQAKEWVETSLKDKQILEEARRVKRDRIKEKRDVKEAEKLQATLLSISSASSLVSSTQEEDKDKVQNDDKKAGISVDENICCET